MAKVDFEIMATDSKCVLIISAVFPPEPAVSANISYDLACKLSVNTPVTVIAPMPSRPYGAIYRETEILDRVPFELQRIKSFVCPQSSIVGRMRESISFGLEAAKYIKGNAKRIKCIYINSWPLFSQLIITRIAHKYKIPIILHIQDVYPESLTNKINIPGIQFVKWLFQKIDKRILDLSGSIIGISPSMIDYLSKTRKVDLNKFFLVRNWQNDDLFKDCKISSVSNDVFTFMFVGNIAASACVDIIIKAFKRIEQANVHLVIAGDGSQKVDCMNLAKNLNVNNISFCPISPNEVPAMQSKADCLLLALKEGVGRTATPSKLTAYCFSGKPIIACVDEGCDTDKIISSSKCGIVVYPENEVLLAEAMLEMIQMPSDELCLMGARGRKYAEDHLSKEVNLDMLSSIVYKYD